MAETMGNNAYHSHEAISSTQLKEILRSQAHFYAEYRDPEREPKKQTPDMILGSLTHCLFLEPHLFDAEYIVSKKFDKRSNAGKAEAEFFEAQAGSRQVINEDMLRDARGMVRSLKSHPLYRVMQKDYGLPEASIFWTDDARDMKLRVRPDWHIPPCAKWPLGLIIDLKTTDDARYEAFRRTCVKFAYDLSCAMYRDGFQQFYQTEEPPPFLLLVAERDRPYNCIAYNTSDLFQAIGEQRYRKAKDTLAECLLLDQWHGYTQEINDISLPPYMTTQFI